MKIKNKVVLQKKNHFIFIIIKLFSILCILSLKIKFHEKKKKKNVILGFKLVGSRFVN